MIITTNRQARHDYNINKELEVGIVLNGQEIKSIRKRQINLKGSFIQIKNNELFLIGAHISHHTNASGFLSYNETRTRKLLAKKSEIKNWANYLKLFQSATIIPLDVHLSNGKAKLKIGLASGKKKHDKRQALKEKDQKRQIDRDIKLRSC